MPGRDWLAIQAYEELRVDEHSFQRELDAGVKALAVASATVEEVK